MAGVVLLGEDDREGVLVDERAGDVAAGDVIGGVLGALMQVNCVRIVAGDVIDRQGVDDGDAALNLLGRVDRTDAIAGQRIIVVVEFGRYVVEGVFGLGIQVVAGAGVDMGEMRFVVLGAGEAATEQGGNGQEYRNKRDECPQRRRPGYASDDETSACLLWPTT